MRTKFAPAERMARDLVLEVSQKLQTDVLLPWLDAIPVSILVVNECRQIVFCNSRFKELSRRFSPQDITGMRPGEALSCVNADVEEGGCGCSSFCTQCGAAIAIVSSLRGVADCQECHLLRKDDLGESVLDLQVFTTPVIFEGVSFTLFTAIDISHEKRLKHLERLFFHKLINEAGGMAALGDMLHQGDAPPESPRLLEECARHMLRDVFYHRDVVAAESGRLVVTPGDVDLQALLRSLQAECAGLSEARGAGIELSGDCPEVVTDHRLLRHVLRSMLLNALEANAQAPVTEDGRLAPVTIACQSTSRGAAITVSNRGEIPENIQLQLFRRYVSSKGEGRGLGAYVMKLLGEQYLKGCLSFESAGGMTRFTLELPALLEED